MKTRLEDGKIHMETDGVTVEVDLYQLFDCLDGKDQIEVAQALTWGPVLDEAMRRLTGDSVSWCGSDREKGVEFLAKVAEHAMGAGMSSFFELKQLARNIHKHKEIYWKLYHADSNGNRWGQKWLEREGITDNYHDDCAGVEELVERFDETLRTLSEGYRDFVKRNERDKYPRDALDL